jgi:putative tryptophan/tyrosine transport system substrate-binding protein
MRRRDFITVLGGAAAWPMAARAQQPAMPVIGWLNSAAADAYPARVRVEAFRKGLSETGYVEGRNVAIEYRWADEQYDRLPALAADLVRRQVALIAATGAVPSAFAAKTATTTIPIVSTMPFDPVTAGLVASLNRPGGNLTGASNLNVEITPKRLEILHELLPAATEFAALINPANNSAETQTRDLQAAASKLGLTVRVLHATKEQDFPAAFAALMRLGVGGLVIAGDGVFISRSEQLAILATRHAVPTIFQNPEFTMAGGLMSYGGSSTESYHAVGVYAGRILKGEKPADLPVQQSTKVELFINLKTAKALGLTVPLSLLGRADEVIE